MVEFWERDSRPNISKDQVLTVPEAHYTPRTAQETQGLPNVLPT